MLERRIGYDSAVRYPAPPSADHPLEEVAKEPASIGCCGIVADKAVRERNPRIALLE